MDIACTAPAREKIVLVPVVTISSSDYGHGVILLHRFSHFNGKMKLTTLDFKITSFYLVCITCNVSSSATISSVD